MPKNKSYADRREIYNELLRIKKWRRDEIINRVENRLTKISESTFNHDIISLRKEVESKGAKLICEDGFYFYEPKDFNLNEIKIDQYSLQRIKEAALILKQFSGFELYQDLMSAFNKLDERNAVIEDESEIIQFDTRKEYTGLKYLEELMSAIQNETVIEFSYQPFYKEESTTIILHPYLLKEWNNRWFIIGLPEYLKEQRVFEYHTYGLERIKGKIKIASGREFYKHYTFDAKTYFKDTIGVTKEKNAQPEEIVLRFSAERVKYIETNPLHHSQQKAPNETNAFRYFLIPNKELTAIILSYGADVEVVAPESLKTEVKKIILEHLKKLNLGDCK